MLCMTSQKSLMVAYVEIRKDATKRMSTEAGYSLGMLVNTVAMANATIPVPLAKMGATQVAQTALSWVGVGVAPTMAAFAPVTIGLSAVATVGGLYQLYKTRQEKTKLEGKINQLRDGIGHPLSRSLTPLL